MRPPGHGGAKRQALAGGLLQGVLERNFVASLDQNPMALEHSGREAGVRKCGSCRTAINVDKPCFIKVRPNEVIIAQVSIHFAFETWK